MIKAYFEKKKIPSCIQMYVNTFQSQEILRDCCSRSDDREKILIYSSSHHGDDLVLESYFLLPQRNIRGMIYVDVSRAYEYDIY